MLAACDGFSGLCDLVKHTATGNLFAAFVRKTPKIGWGRQVDRQRNRDRLTGQKDIARMFTDRRSGPLPGRQRLLSTRRLCRSRPHVR